jgi:hypothetical protein
MPGQLGARHITSVEQRWHFPVEPAAKVHAAPDAQSKPFDSAAIADEVRSSAAALGRRQRLSVSDSAWR